MRILRGAEANIMDMEGNLDIGGEVLSQLDWVIARFPRRRLPARNSGSKHPGLPRCSQTPMWT